MKINLQKYVLIDKTLVEYRIKELELEEDKFLSEIEELKQVLIWAIPAEKLASVAFDAGQQYETTESMVSLNGFLKSDITL